MARPALSKNPIKRPGHIKHTLKQQIQHTKYGPTKKADTLPVATSTTQFAFLEHPNCKASTAPLCPARHERLETFHAVTTAADEEGQLSTSERVFGETELHSKVPKAQGFRRTSEPTFQN
jgi:hypothetical protein